jgi:hypothetical protein
VVRVKPSPVTMRVDGVLSLTVMDDRDDVSPGSSIPMPTPPGARRTRRVELACVTRRRTAG